MATEPKIPSSRFYGEYHGHKVKHLKQIYPRLRERSDALIWTAGDSSLDNKYWYVVGRCVLFDFSFLLFYVRHTNSLK